MSKIILELTDSKKRELQEAIRKLDEAQDYLCEAEERLMEAECVVSGIRERNQQEDISSNLPSMAVLKGFSLRLHVYTAGVAAMLIQHGEEIKTWGYIPSLTELFEATE